MPSGSFEFGIRAEVSNIKVQVEQVLLIVVYVLSVSASGQYYNYDVYDTCGGVFTPLLSSKFSCSRITHHPSVQNARYAVVTVRIWPTSANQGAPSVLIKSNANGWSGAVQLPNKISSCGITAS